MADNSDNGHRGFAEMGKGILNVFLGIDEAVKRDMIALLEKAKPEYADTRETKKRRLSTGETGISREEKDTSVICELLVAISKLERNEAKQQVSQESIKIGNWKLDWNAKVWEQSPAVKATLRQLKKIVEKKQATVGLKGNNTEEELRIYQLASLLREEQILMMQHKVNEVAKVRLIQEIQRIQDEDNSKYKDFQILNDRYALLNLLGKGGFSEVYKAFDLIELRYVACKIQDWDPSWQEQRKGSNLRLYRREGNIMTTLKHRNIVQVLDTFEINEACYIILEYCTGYDLEMMLKESHVLSERHAKTIGHQIVQGLLYLNQRSPKIIHYDLKPANILFTEEGVAKISDFGLSKIMLDVDEIELSSPGAGTYSYLPLECLNQDKPYFISSKDFIRLCLTCDQEKRPGVLEIARHPFMKSA